MNLKFKVGDYVIYRPKWAVTYNQPIKEFKARIKALSGPLDIEFGPYELSCDGKGFSVPEEELELDIISIRDNKLKEIGI